MTLQLIMKGFKGDGGHCHTCGEACQAGIDVYEVKYEGKTELFYFCYVCAVVHIANWLKAGGVWLSPSGSAGIIRPMDMKGATRHGPSYSGISEHSA